ncbi:MAG TPA: hypothetical protein VNO21_16185, partial [Polyangiaceae bacterium]|nr:hypothetical protein [Polyangiaceae bacterium]
FRAAGRASSSAWSVSARVEPHGDRYRLELEVCQVKSGRVESLAREIDSSKAAAQIGEMLSLLLRPDGLGNADIPWEHEMPALPPATPAPSPQAPALPPPPPPQPAAQSQPPAPSAPRRAYGEGRPLSVGAALNVLGAFVRPEHAQGTATSLFVSGAIGYALDAVPGLELRADFGGAVAGPRALLLEGGARYARVLEPRLRIYAGPEVEVGGFFTLDADTTPRFFARGSAFGGIGVTDRVAIELTADLAVAPGGAGTLVFGGGGARGVVRF